MLLTAGGQASTSVAPSPTITRLGMIIKYQLVMNQYNRPRMKTEMGGGGGSKQPMTMTIRTSIPYLLLYTTDENVTPLQQIVL